MEQVHAIAQARGVPPAQVAHGMAGAEAGDHVADPWRRRSRTISRMPWRRCRSGLTGAEIAALEAPIVPHAPVGF
ncbi:hypothetical protein ACU4GD_22715 [Cupriavidus basilensis]